MRWSLLKGTVEFSPIQQSFVCRQLGYTSLEDNTEILPEHCFDYWLYGLLSTIQFLTSEQRQLLFTELLAAGIHSVEDPMIVFADRKYVIWRNHHKWLNLTDGTFVPKPAVTPLETIAYNLTAMVRRQTHIAENAATGV